MALELYPGNTQTLILPKLRDQNGNPVTGATITATLYKKNALAAPVDERLHDLALADVVGVPGDYSGEISGLFSPPEGRNYTVVYSGSKSGSQFRLLQPAEVVPLTVG